MKPERMRRVVEILREEAQCLKESYGTPPDFDWPKPAWDTCGAEEAKASHDEMLELAVELEQHVEAGTPARPAPCPRR